MATKLPFDIVPSSPFKGMRFEAENANIETLLKEITKLRAEVDSGLTVVVITAKRTFGGTEGSLTFVNGRLTESVEAT